MLVHGAQVLACVGAGAHGRVYKALWGDKLVAIKVIQHEVDAQAAKAQGTSPGQQQASGLDSQMSPGTPASAAADADAGSPATNPPTEVDAVSKQAASTPSSCSAAQAQTTGQSSEGQASQAAQEPAADSDQAAVDVQRDNSKQVADTAAKSSAEQGNQPAAAPAKQQACMSMDNKHIAFEGMVGVSARHPNVVETYRIITQPASGVGSGWLLDFLGMTAMLL